MSWNYASAAHQDRARQRRKTPKLERAEFEWRGLYAFKRKGATALQVWDPNYEHWLGPYSNEVVARLEMERIATARERMVTLTAQKVAEKSS